MIPEEVQCQPLPFQIIFSQTLSNRAMKTENATDLEHIKFLEEIREIILEVDSKLLGIPIEELREKRKAEKMEGMET